VSIFKFVYGNYVSTFIKRSVYLKLPARLLKYDAYVTSRNKMSRMYNFVEHKKMPKCVATGIFKIFQ